MPDWEKLRAVIDAERAHHKAAASVCHPAELVDHMDRQEAAECALADINAVLKAEFDLLDLKRSTLASARAFIERNPLPEGVEIDWE